MPRQQPSAMTSPTPCLEAHDDSASTGTNSTERGEEPTHVERVGPTVGAGVSRDGLDADRRRGLGSLRRGGHDGLRRPGRRGLRRLGPGSLGRLGLRRLGSRRSRGRARRLDILEQEIIGTADDHVHDGAGLDRLGPRLGGTGSDVDRADGGSVDVLDRLERPGGGVGVRGVNRVRAVGVLGERGVAELPIRHHERRLNRGGVPALVVDLVHQLVTIRRPAVTLDRVETGVEVEQAHVDVMPLLGVLLPGRPGTQAGGADDGAVARLGRSRGDGVGTVEHLGDATGRLEGHVLDHGGPAQRHHLGPVAGRGREVTLVVEGEGHRCGPGRHGEVIDRVSGEDAVVVQRRPTPGDQHRVGTGVARAVGHPLDGEVDRGGVRRRLSGAERGDLQLGGRLDGRGGAQHEAERHDERLQRHEGADDTGALALRRQMGHDVPFPPGVPGSSLVALGWR